MAHSPPWVMATGRPPVSTPMELTKSRMDMIYYLSDVYSFKGLVRFIMDAIYNFIDASSLKKHSKETTLLYPPASLP
jgi:hypothetical protein